MTAEGALIVKRDGELTEEWHLAPNRPFTIGRGATCDLQLADRQVSRMHSMIQLTDRGWIVEDNSSKNGTWLNGVQVQQPTVLRDGDELSIAARYKVYFVDADATAPMVFERRGLRIDHETLSVYVNGMPIEPQLSGPQYELLKQLYDAEGGLVTRDDIVEHIWSDSHAGGVSEDALDALVRRLRMRIAEYDDEHDYIVTLRGYGFRLDMPQ